MSTINSSTSLNNSVDSLNDPRSTALDILDSFKKVIAFLEEEEYAPAIYTCVKENKTWGVMGGNDRAALGVLGIFTLSEEEKRSIYSSVEPLTDFDVFIKFGEVVKHKTTRYTVSCLNKLPKNINWFNFGTALELYKQSQSL